MFFGDTYSPFLIALLLQTFQALRQRWISVRYVSRCRWAYRDRLRRCPSEKEAKRWEFWCPMTLGNIRICKREYKCVLVLLVFRHRVSQSRDVCLYEMFYSPIFLGMVFSGPHHFYAKIFACSCDKLGHELLAVVRRNLGRYAKVADLVLQEDFSYYCCSGYCCQYLLRMLRETICHYDDVLVATCSLSVDGPVCCWRWTREVSSREATVIFVVVFFFAGYTRTIGILWWFCIRYLPCTAGSIGSTLSRACVLSSYS